METTSIAPCQRLGLGSRIVSTAVPPGNCRARCQAGAFQGVWWGEAVACPDMFNQ